VRVIFSLDIDGVWSEDPKCLLAIHNIIKSFGHEVVIVTGREQPMEKLDRLGIPMSTKLIVSGNRSKRRALQDHGYVGNVVFVDDDPGACCDEGMLQGELGELD